MKQEQVIELAKPSVATQWCPGWHLSTDEVAKLVQLVEQATLEQAALEAKQAEVQMPEPTAYLYHDAPMLADFITNERAAIHINSALFSVKRHPNCRNETPLYSEQQLRALLEQHGIQIA